MGRPLPWDAWEFDRALNIYCPRRHELREQLPVGSLESLSHLHGVKRCGLAHTAGSDALLTLQLFLHLAHTGGLATQEGEAWGPWTSPASVLRVCGSDSCFGEDS